MFPFHPCRPSKNDKRVTWNVWAPKCRNVDLILEKAGSLTRHTMEPTDGDHFTLTLPHFEASQRYGYSLDGGPPRPDPVTVSQPDGVHQLSTVVFPEAFDWEHTTQAISRNDLILYELHIGTFTTEGTFAAAAKRLPDLVDLGISAVEILPVAQFPGSRNWGYDGVHPFATQHSYGGPNEFMKFIDVAHGLGLAVILDVVFNHLGPEGNYLNEFAPYFTDLHPTPWGPGFNFDGDNSQPVRDWFLECTWQWIHDFRLDGLRLDAVHAMVDMSDKHILTEIKETADKAAKERGGTAIIIAESLRNDPRMITPVAEGGLGLDLEWNEDFHHSVSAWMTGEAHGKYVDYQGIETIKTVMRDNFRLAGQDSTYYGEPWGKPAHDIPADRFVISLQNHDHIGNRARGERLASLVTTQQLRLGACLTILGPFVPMLFMGEEYGETNPFLFFCSFGDPDVISGVRRGRKRDYGLKGAIPDPQSVDSFTDSILSWDWESEARRSLRELYQSLINLRKSTPSLTVGSNLGSISLVGKRGEERLQIDRGEFTTWFNLSPLTQPLPEEELLWRSEESTDGLAPFETILVRR
ncbi:MAG: malto-oligosyltrehalose trehalohydrolase [Verrucomicrobiales bacterium]|nr:malto-oligosyltrehalose trehalohydrolase [Verrucomicrobiales bacterium]